jgi:hypothetical protein
MHRHNPSCAKRGGQADDDHCRFGYPIPEQTATTRDEATGALFLQRRCTFVVPYNVAMMLAVPANMSMNLLGECSKWAHAADVARRTKQPVPPLPQAIDSAADASDYTLTYGTKADNQGTNTAFLQSADAIAAKEAHLNSADDATKLAARRVTQAANISSTSTTYPATLITVYLLGKQDCYFSHAFASFDHRAFARQLYDAYATAGGTEQAFQLTPAGRIVTRVQDYLQRGPELEDLCPYAMAALFEKKYHRQGDPYDRRHVRLDAEHPHHDTHVLQAFATAKGNFEPRVPWMYAAWVVRPAPPDAPSTLPPTAGEAAQQEAAEALQPGASAAATPTAAPATREHVEYAAYALTAFAAYRAADIAEWQGDPWGAFRRWETAMAAADPPAWQLHVLRRLEQQAATRHRSAQRRQAAAAEAAATESLGDQMLPRPPGAHDSDEDSDPGDGPPEEEPDALHPVTRAAGTDLTAAEAQPLILSGAKLAYGGNVLQHWPQPEALPLDISASSTSPHVTRADSTFKGRASAWCQAARDLPLATEGAEEGAVRRPATEESSGQRPIIPVGIMHSGANTAIPPLTPGQPAPYVRRAVPPTIDECIAYFTLSSDQVAVFGRLATALLDPAADPVRQLVIGGPGSGKSRAAEAFLWFAFQHGRSSEVAVLAYTWRAAMNIATVHNPGTLP